MKKGLILEGGAMRGMYTAGILDVMMENRVEFDGIVGVSAGAAFGLNYKSKQIGRAIRYNVRFCKDPRYCSIRSLIRTGDLYGAEFCWHTLPDQLDLFDAETFRNSEVAFYAVVTDVETGKAVYHRCTTGDAEELDWMRASASMPIVSRPVVLDGRAYLDGGIADPIPLKFFEHLGYDKNVVILTQPDDYVKEPMSHPKMMKMLMRKYPALLERMKKRHLRYNRVLEEIREKEAAGSLFVFRPERKLEIDRVTHDANKLQSVYQLGRDDGKKRLEELREFLAS